MKTTNKKNSIIIIAILLTIFAVDLAFILSGKIVDVDNFISDSIYRNSILTPIMIFITFFGETLTLSSLAILLFFLFKNKKISILIPLNLLIIGSTNSLIKFFVQRERPLNQLIEVSGFSFPSGHSASSLAFYGFLIYLINTRCQNKSFKRVSTIVLGLLILFIGLSRIYLRVHYMSDILGAYAYSGAYLTAYIYIINKVQKTK